MKFVLSEAVLWIWSSHPNGVRKPGNRTGHRLSNRARGKGANQAVAASRLGANVYMVGKAGNDSYGKAIIENLKANGVNTDCMETVTRKKAERLILCSQKETTASSS